MMASMWTRWLALPLVIVALFACTAALVAHDEFRFVGTLISVETAKNRFSMKIRENGKDETIVVKLNAKTVITRDKKPLAKTALKAGQSVVVDALGDDYDDLEAVEISVVPPPSK
jgi:hypothetical protein